MSSGGMPGTVYKNAAADARSSQNPQPNPQQQQQKPPANQKNLDQSSGELEQAIAELLKVDLSAKRNNALEAHRALQDACPTVYQQLNTFQQAMAVGASLADETAKQWKDKGNVEYKNQNIDVAVLNYTKAMTFAETDETLAIIMNNRSTALHFQKRYRDACLDATYALKLNPEYLKALNRRGLCLEALGLTELAAKDAKAVEDENVEGAADHDEVLKLLNAAPEDSLVPRVPLVSEICDKMHVETDPKGRFLVADERLEKGQSILMETPYASAQRLEGTFTSCAMCFRRTSVLYPNNNFRAKKMRCRGLFCSNFCADRYWELYGEREHTNVFFLTCPIDAVLAFRMLHRKHEAIESSSGPLKLRREEGADNKFGSSFFNTLTVLSKEIQPIVEVGGSETVLTSLALAFGAIQEEEAADYRHHLRRIVPNAMPIGCVDRVIPDKNASAQHSFVSVKMGKGIFTVASLFNHSCDPNCFVSFRGQPHSSSAQLCVRLLRPCMQGEELTIAYDNIHISKNHSTRARIRATRSNYGFNCTCTACFNKVDEPVAKEDEQHYFKAADYFQKGRRMTREGNYKEAINVLFQSYECVMKFICPPPRPPQMMLPKTHDALAQAFLLDGDRAKCAEHLRESIRLLEEINGRLDPDLIREYTKLAFLLDGDDAKNFAEKAKDHLRLFYCPSSHLDAELDYLDTAIVPEGGSDAAASA